MRTIRMSLAYDGSDFLGWQAQPRGRTVQAEVERALSQLHQHPVTVVAAGRTDSGVHAAGQVISFQSDHRSLPPQRFHVAVNSLLPPDVRALTADAAADDFHARFHATYRSYRYYLQYGVPATPIGRQYAYRLRQPPPLRQLNRLAAQLVGEHDFTTFAALNDQSATRVRRVYAASFVPTPTGMVFKIVANAFLWRMVRSIVGTLLAAVVDGLDEREFAAIIAARDRLRAGTTAPAWGLVLHAVGYRGDAGGADAQGVWW